MSIYTLLSQKESPPSFFGTDQFPKEQTFTARKSQRVSVPFFGGSPFLLAQANLWTQEEIVQNIFQYYQKFKNHAADYSHLSLSIILQRIQLAFSAWKLAQDNPASHPERISDYIIDTGLPYHTGGTFYAIIRHYPQNAWIDTATLENEKELEEKKYERGRYTAYKLLDVCPWKELGTDVAIPRTPLHTLWSSQQLNPNENFSLNIHHLLHDRQERIPQQKNNPAHLYNNIRIGLNYFWEKILPKNSSWATPWFNRSGILGWLVPIGVNNPLTPDTVVIFKKDKEQNLWIAFTALDKGQTEKASTTLFDFRSESLLEVIYGF